MTYRFNSTFRVSESRLSRGSKRLKAGKKSKEWMAVRRRLSESFREKGIVTCEVRVSRYCTPTTMLTWAHGRKRRLLRDGELESLVCLCCQNCHHILDEVMSHEEMLRVVQNVIDCRATNVDD